jgi:hypothetical protein
VEAAVSERYNYATVKYTPNGDTVWVRTYNGTGSDEDRAYAIAVDDEGNVFVTGASWGILDDYATIKYDSSGVQQWVARYNGPVNSYDKAYDLKLDNDGNVYVTGASGGEGLNYDYVTIKYNPDGGEEWIARYNGPDNYNDYAAALALDGLGNIFVTGYSENAPSPFISTTDYTTIKYNANGAEQWISRYNGPGNYYDKGAAIAADQNGNVYVTGKTEYYQQQNSADIATLKYATATAVRNNEGYQEAVSIFPNPTRGKICISTSKAIEKIVISDVTGGTVLISFPGIAGQDQYEVDLSGLASGVYFAKISIDKATFIEKIMKK